MATGNNHAERANGKQQTANSIKQYRCPNCNNILSIGEQCSCNDPVNYGVLEYRQGQLVCVGYTDKHGNIWRF